MNRIINMIFLIEEKNIISKTEPNQTLFKKSEKLNKSNLSRLNDNNQHKSVISNLSFSNILKDNNHNNIQISSYQIRKFS